MLLNAIACFHSEEASSPASPAALRGARPGLSIIANDLVCLVHRLPDDVDVPHWIDMRAAILAHLGITKWRLRSIAGSGFISQRAVSVSRMDRSREPSYSSCDRHCLTRLAVVRGLATEG